LTRPTVATDPLEADVIVLGAGLAGAAIALELATRKRRVALVGMRGDALAPSLGHALVGPGMPYLTAIERFGREHARLVWESQRENGDRLRLFVDGLRDGCDYRRGGGFLLAADRAEGLRLADSEDLLREDGFPGEFLDHYMLEARFEVAGFAGAYWAADDAELDVARLQVALVAAAAAEGAIVRPAGSAVTLVVDDGFALAESAAGRVRAPWAVLTAEEGLGPLLGPLAERVRSVPLHGLTLRTVPGALLPSPALTADGALAWQVSGDRLILAGRGSVSSETPHRGVLDAMARRLGGVPGSGLPWEAAVGATADGLPMIGLLPDRPLAVALGLRTLAASYAFMAARWIGEAITSGRDPTPPPLRPHRPWFEPPLVPQ
jgi:glycine/D-amino acid oxidase-like deaminating enzyme